MIVPPPWTQIRSCARTPHALWVRASPCETPKGSPRPRQLDLAAVRSLHSLNTQRGVQRSETISGLMVAPQGYTYNRGASGGRAAGMETA